MTIEISINQKAKEILANTDFHYQSSEGVEWSSVGLMPMEKAILVSASEQILNGRGFHRESPLDDLGTVGFYTVSRFFQCRVVKLDTLECGGELIDEITLESITSQSQCKMYNRVKS